ncbi:DUF960 family protein [Enterococcus pseudoavium]|uniref:DUF960 family protein n=1 Tax=Enterococcus pseudoavium TaxID=44007 RepID=A0ABU3FFV2_9ENTE|nr:DUF960 family protein [Enterococcus pseudoavium]MDT2754306.1 DUF960 family protein [Enterococcus pseudoavium]MDT2769912.1 DUF960 family protein [Enterococcus pseudoavium]
MFDTQENRYITRGVNDTIPKEIQLHCWQLIKGKTISVIIRLLTNF